MHLPAVNATLNGVAACLLVLGWRAIRAGQRERHALLMRSAFGVSVAFLACYLYYHFAVARGEPTRFHRTGFARGAYLGLLLSHTVLAAVNLPMVLRTLWLAHRGDWERHRRLARWTFPIWLYVSVTGVVVYVVLYHFNVPPPVSTSARPVLGLARPIHDLHRSTTQAAAPGDLWVPGEPLRTRPPSTTAQPHESTGMNSPG